VSLAALFLVFGWFGAQLRSITWNDTYMPAKNAWLIAVVLRQFWDNHAGQLAGSTATVLCFSALLWFNLEAFFRRRIVQRVLGGPACAHKTFLASRALKIVVLTAAGMTLFLITFSPYLTTPPSQWPGLWPETRGIAIASFVTFAGLAFLLTIFETLLRTGAMDLLGTDLIRVTSLIGSLVLFESMLGASLLIALVAGFLNVASATGAITMTVILVIAALFRSLIHSYLLLVRFSTVGIMRRNALDV